MLNNKAVLIKPAENKAPVAVDPVTIAFLIGLHANGVHVVDMKPDDQKVKFRAGGDYLTARYEKTSDLFVIGETYVERLYDGD